jgi:hypothetical protein
VYLRITVPALSRISSVSAAEVESAALFNE